MTTLEFTEYIDAFLRAGELSLARRFYGETKNFKESLESNADTEILRAWFLIYDLERKLKEDSFTEGKNSLEEIKQYYVILKFFLRRFDFDVQSYPEDFITFIESANVNASAIVVVINGGMINKTKVMNQTRDLLKTYEKTKLVENLMRFEL